MLENAKIVQFNDIKDNYFDIAFPHIASILKGEGVFLYFDIDERISKPISKYRLFEFLDTDYIVKKIKNDDIIIQYKKDISYDSYENIKNEVLSLCRGTSLELLKDRIREMDLILDHEMDVLWKRFIHDEDNSVGIQIKIATSIGTFMISNIVGGRTYSIISNLPSSKNIISTVEYFFGLKNLGTIKFQCMILVDKKADYWFDCTEFLVEWYREFERNNVEDHWTKI